MRRLTVLYDPECPLCVRAHRFLLSERKYVPLEFVPAGSATALARFPTLPPDETLRTLTVVGDAGQLYRGDKAFVMCLWALQRTRGLALSIAASDVGLARRAFLWVSRNRRRISRWFGLE